MRIVAYSTEVVEGKVLLRESTGEYIWDNDIEKLFTFLLEPYDETLKICWDLDVTVSLLLRLLGKSACKALQRLKKWHEGGWHIFYIPSKIFSLSYGRNKASLYGLQQYYPDMGEPATVEEVKILGDGLLIELRKMGFTPTKLTSPVAIYEESILSKLDLPKLKDIPPEVGAMAYRCSSKLWIEAHCLGFYE